MSLLIIAGYECNGFAGLLRDVYVAHDCGQQAAAVLTTLTAQSTSKLLAASAVESSLFHAQLMSLTANPTVVKIGLLPNRDIALQLSQWLATLTIKPTVVLDPVMTSSSNQQTFIGEPLITIVEPLLPFIDLITPNVDELKAMVSEPYSKHTMATLAALFFDQQLGFNGALLLKGGHVNDGARTVTDALFERTEKTGLGTGLASHQWQQPKQKVELRGTGCFLSTAIACAIREGYRLLDAITLANAKLATQFQQGRTSKTQLGHHWPTTLTHYPHVTNNEVAYLPTAPFPKLDVRYGLYPVVDSSGWVKMLADSGIKTIQLRIKNQPTEVIKQEIIAAVRIAKQHSLQLFINDYWQLAIECGAYGVHLGQEDLADANLMAILAAGLRLGVSTHGDFELRLAHQIRPSYLAVGAIFPTQTKDMSGQIQGLTRLKRYRELITDIPLVAIGGINMNNIESVMQTGVNMAAVVSAITHASDPVESCEDLQRLCLG